MKRGVKMTYEIAMACFKDAANASMCRAGRTAWNEDDYNAGCAVFHRLWPEGAA